MLFSTYEISLSGFFPFSLDSPSKGSIRVKKVSRNFWKKRNIKLLLQKQEESSSSIRTAKKDSNTGQTLVRASNYAVIKYSCNYREDWFEHVG